MKFNYLIYSLLVLIFFGCAQNKSEDMQGKNIENNQIKYDNKESSNYSKSKPFYPMDETMDDIQNQINDLKTRVIEYESRINNVALDPNLCLKSSFIINSFNFSIAS